MASRTVPIRDADPDLDHLLVEVEYEKMVAAYAGNALLGAPADTPHVYADGTGMYIKVRANKYAHLCGELWLSGTDEFNLGPFSSNTSGKPRWDLAVLQMDRGNDRIIDEVIKEGTPGDNPILPGLQRDPDVIAGGTGKWEVPLAKVIVPPGATNIAPTNCIPIRIYLAPQSLVAASDATTMSFIPAAPSLRVYQADVDRTVIGNGTVFNTGIEDSAYKVVTAAPGWSVFYGDYRNRNGEVSLVFSFKRTAGQVRAGSEITMGSVPQPFAPARNRPFAVSFGAGVFGEGTIVRGTGQILLQKYAVNVPTNQLVTSLCPINWFLG